MPSDRPPPTNEGAEAWSQPEAVGGPVLDDVERALLAQLHFAAGSWQAGLALVHEPEHHGASLLAARAHFGMGDLDTALGILDRRLAAQPDAVLALYYKAQFLAQSGRAREGMAALERLISLMPDFPGALLALAQLVFPGPPYREFLRRVHDRLRPRSYLEIGVEHGTTLALAVHSQVAVGIDPVARPPTRALPVGARLFHTTSDGFFAEQRREEIFGEQPLELAFIDGMHWFEYALRDFHNVERWCARGSTVILHDCLPAAAVAAARQRKTRVWVGDTWKALEYLLRERPDLTISIVPCYPSGLVVIQNLDPDSKATSEALAERSARYLSLDYPYAPGAWPSHYSIVPNSEPHLTRLLASLGGGDLASPR